jgi:hypothetical protein
MALPLALRPRVFCHLLLLAFASAPFAAAEDPSSAPTQEGGTASEDGLLFDGRTLDGWEVLEKFSFKAHGAVAVAEEQIVLEAGSPATGIRFAGEVPTDDYELSLEAMRVAGGDFFCGLTFPVGEAPCTLIVGGWGGGVVGLSNVDGQPAVENETTRFMQFKEGQWYKVRLRVAGGRIAAWIDDEQVVDLATAKRKFSVWWEQEPARPLGIATWHTKAALRNIRLAPVDASAWRPLFDGRSLHGWKVSEFGGAGDVAAQDGTIRIGYTDGCNGITYNGFEELPRDNYEIELEAMRVDGNDFFCGLTFPVRDDPCSLIVGGWGGAVVGLSSLDGQDASENETTRQMGFETGRWYRIRLRVAASRIAAWIDDESVVDVDTAGKRISIRPEVEESKPLGIASWCTTAALRGIRLRTLAQGDAAPAPP